MAAVAELRYHTNVIAQGLKKGTSRTVALIVPDISNPFLPGGVQQAAQPFEWKFTRDDLARLMKKLVAQEVRRPAA